jgi:hypothetical protein
MFDRTIILTSNVSLGGGTDNTVTLTIKAGTEGLKSLIVNVDGQDHPITERQLIDLAAPTLLSWARGDT